MAHKHIHRQMAANEFEKQPQRDKLGTPTIDEVRETCRQLQYRWPYPKGAGGQARTLQEAMADAGVSHTKYDYMRKLFLGDKSLKEWKEVAEEIEAARQKLKLRDYHRHYRRTRVF